MTTSVGVRWSAKEAKTKAEINKEDDDGWIAFEVCTGTAAACTVIR